MFTGIVEAQGTITQVTTVGDSAVLTCHCPAVEGSPHGASIALDGVCLTVVDSAGVVDGTFSVDVMGETLNRTTIGELVAGDVVNVERAMPAHGRLDGHVVQGHVDATSIVQAIEPHENWTTLTFSLPASLSQFLVEKGSITVSGVSLTVTDVSDIDAPEGSFSVGLIPTTLDVTTLGTLCVGDKVNLETDILAKYAVRLLSGQALPIAARKES